MAVKRDRVSEPSRHEMDDIHELTGVIDGIISMMAAGNIGSLKLEYGSLRLSLQAKDRRSRQPALASEGQEPAETTTPEPTPETASGHIVRAPMIGTFYVAPAPNEPPFVTPGDLVEEGQTIGIIEAMKIMNEIAADRSGKVVEVLAADGQTVEYGSPLLRIEAHDG